MKITFHVKHTRARKRMGWIIKASTWGWTRKSERVEWGFTKKRAFLLQQHLQLTEQDSATASDKSKMSMFTLFCRTHVIVTSQLEEAGATCKVAEFLRRRIFFKVKLHLGREGLRTRLDVCRLWGMWSSVFFYVATKTAAKNQLAWIF